MNHAITIPALGDNYIYLYQCADNTALAIDPGDSKPVLSVLESCRLTLKAVLATHNHFDHTAGARDLKKKTDCQIIGPERSGIPGIDQIVEDAEIIELSGTSIRVIATPGHTATSVCYYIRPAEDRPGCLFTGDTLFIAGCGRPFECDPETMWNSLEKLAALPDETLLYPGHNYTQENYQFALTIEPDNQTVRDLLNKADFTPPSSIAREKQTNVFLRTAHPQIRKALKMPNATNAEIFAELRQRKNIFG